VVLIIATGSEQTDIDHVYETLKIRDDVLAAGLRTIQERLWEHMDGHSRTQTG
jgi:hypothetical protein